MFRWLALPMLRASLAFGLGILLGLQSDLAFKIPPYIWYTGIFIYLLALKAYSLAPEPGKVVLSFYVCLMLMSAGTIRSHWLRHSPDSIIGKADVFQAKVSEPTKLHGKFYRTTLIINRAWANKIPYNVDNGLILYQRPEQVSKLQYGDIVLINATPSQIEPPANPYQFNYASYMRNRNIFWYQWLDNHQIIEVLPDPTNSLRSQALSLRSMLGKRLESYLPPGIATEITGAMLLGDRSFLTAKTEQNFASSGAIHVLAVSGLHLGIIYWGLLQVIGCWRRHSLLKWMFTLSGLTVIWGFTLVTGMAASTLRAATMFSVLLVGNLFSRQRNTKNTLAVAAMIILWFDPYQLYSVGFQLSFLALAGILYLQPWLSNRLESKNKILNYFCQLLSVSLSAQIMVMPLSMYYFHQLPVYFLLSNLILVPLTFMIIIVGMIFFACGLSQLLSTMVAAPLHFLTKVAGSLVQLIADLPVSTVQNLYPNFYQLILYYIIIITLIEFVISRSRTWWLLFLTTLSTGVFGQLYQNLQHLNTKQLLIYQIPGHTAIDYRQANRLYSIIDPELQSDSSKISYLISPNRNYTAKSEQEVSMLPWNEKTSLDLWEFEGKQILLIKYPLLSRPYGDFKLKSHITILTNNSVKDIHQITAIETDLLVIDGSYGKSLAGILEQQADSMGIPVHNGWSKGYKLVKL